MSDFLPIRENDLTAWYKNFVSVATTNMAALGLVAADITALSGASTGYTGSVDACNTSQQAAKSARQTKLTNHTSSSKVFRRYAKDLRNRLTVTDAQLEALGLRPREPQATLMSVAAVASASKPAATIDNSKRLIHSLRFAEQGQSASKARPQGVKGCEVWSCVLAAGSPAPADESSMKYIDTPSSGPLVVNFDAVDAGKIAWYRLRWVANDGSKGEWSDMASAMILG